jgi:hypothetical protein
VVRIVGQRTTFVQVTCAVCAGQGGVLRGGVRGG